jgi:diguanylate cyclase (GGDEF)-like protein
MTSLLHVLWLGDPPADLAASAWGPFDVRRCASLDEAAQALAERRHDALVLAAGTEPSAVLQWQALSHAVLDAAVVVAGAVSPDVAAQLVRRGVQDLLPADGLDTPTLARALRLGVERKRLETTARKAYATDLSTGLPNHAQLLEHMTHLLALREREPAPMALLVLRVEGLSTIEAALGTEAVNVLRRKLAVRLRAALRASDVVASIGTDAFAVLLAWIDAPRDSGRVAEKLSRSLRQTFNVAGQERTVAVSVGLSQYPDHGREAEDLLHRAIGQAAGTAAMGREGFANRTERGAVRAANDEETGPR